MEHSSGIILFRKENKEIKFLLLHYEEGHWDFAKGHLEGEEDAKTAAIRELEEETKITSIKFISGFEETIHYIVLKDGLRSKKRVDFFLAETGEFKVRLSPEHVGYAWLTYHEALERLTFRTGKELLNKAYPIVAAQ